MPTNDDVAWFKQQFGKAIEQQVAGTPFTLDMLTAIACQETGYLWCRLRKRNLPIERIVELCVGDTISNRSAFPRAKGELLAWPRGREMFAIARAALVDLAQYLKDFEGPAANPDKFCHGFGIFQYDIQFFKTNPSYFLERRWRDLDQCIARCVGELKAKMAKAGVAGQTKLTDQEMAQVAIAYNRGSYDPAKGLKQGHKNQDGKYYGECFAEFLKQAKQVKPAASAVPPLPAAATIKVDTSGATLNLRARPQADAPILAALPNGHSLTGAGEANDGWVKVRTKLDGQELTGWVAERYTRTT